MKTQEKYGVDHKNKEKQVKEPKNGENKENDTAHRVVLKDGTPVLRFGPVVLGYSANGKDGCGY